MDSTWNRPNFLNNEAIKIIIEQIESVIESGLIKVLGLAQFSEIIYNDDVVETSECHEISRKNAFGLMIMEIWFCVKQMLNRILRDNDSIPSLRNVYEVFLNVMIEGVKNAIDKYRLIISQMICSKLADMLSRFNVALSNIDDSAGLEFRRIIVASLSIIMENNGAEVMTRLRNAGFALLTGIINIIKPNENCANLYELFLQIIAIIQNSVSLFDSLIGAFTERDFAYFNQQRLLVEQYYAELMQLDLERFRIETDRYRYAGERIASARTEREINLIVRRVLQDLGITMSWETTHDSFNSFMQDRNARMRFE